MRSRLPYFILGYHGCDQSTAESILTGKSTHLRKSKNRYDWLGNGTYFWENNPRRAMDYAIELASSSRPSASRITRPAVVGAIIDPGYCLDLLEQGALDLLALAYGELKTALQNAEAPMPQNKAPVGENELKLRNLDCAVIEFIHSLREENNAPPFETVRGVFFEGDEIYPTAGFRQKNHIQICVRNTSCIKGYFRVLEM